MLINVSTDTPSIDIPTNRIWQRSDDHDVEDATYKDQHVGYDVQNYGNRDNDDIGQELY